MTTRVRASLFLSKMLLLAVVSFACIVSTSPQSHAFGRHSYRSHGHHGTGYRYSRYGRHCGSRHYSSRRYHDSSRYGGYRYGEYGYASDYRAPAHHGPVGFTIRRTPSYSRSGPARGLIDQSKHSPRGPKQHEAVRTYAGQSSASHDTSASSSIPESTLAAPVAMREQYPQESADNATAPVLDGWALLADDPAAALVMIASLAYMRNELETARRAAEEAIETGDRSQTTRLLLEAIGEQPTP